MITDFLAGNEKQVGKAEFRLGRAYEEYGDSDAAIKVTWVFSCIIDLIRTA